MTNHLNQQSSLLKTPSSSQQAFETLLNQAEKQGAESSNFEYYCFSPGRLNLIGDHIDYCGGVVFPSTVSMGTYAIARKINEPLFRFHSLNFEQSIQVKADFLDYSEEDHWANYPKGILKHLQQEFLTDFSQGIEFFFWGNLPVASGLSSSASILLCTLFIAKKAYAIRFAENEIEDRKKSAWFAQKVENQYIGLTCGIMDQAVISLGKKDHALLLDCSNLDFETIPILNTGKTKILIANTNKQRRLDESKYNERKAESDESLQILQKTKDIHNLCEITAEEKEATLHLIQDPILKKRTKHIIEENLRVHQAKQTLIQQDFQSFGALLKQSHDSLKENYEVTGFELDSLVNAALEQKQVLGARMTGAGFSGCCVLLLEGEEMELALEKIRQIYREKTGLNADFFPCIPPSGVRLETKIF